MAYVRGPEGIIVSLAERIGRASQPLLWLRIFEACGSSIADLGEKRGHRVLDATPRRADSKHLAAAATELHTAIVAAVLRRAARRPWSLAARVYRVVEGRTGRPRPAEAGRDVTVEQLYRYRHPSVLDGDGLRLATSGRPTTRTFSMA